VGARVADDLAALARARFNREFTQAEERLLQAAPEGKIAYCGPNKDDDDPANNPADSITWGPERELRAELIRWLCVDRELSKDRFPRNSSACWQGHRRPRRFLRDPNLSPCLPPLSL